MLSQDDMPWRRIGLGLLLCCFLGGCAGQDQSLLPSDDGIAPLYYQLAAEAANRNFVGVIGLQPPYVFFDPKQDDNNQFSGFCIDLLNAIVSDLNINMTYTLYLNPDNQLGNLLGDGTWTGVLGEIVNNRADFSVGPVAVNYERAKAVDFTNPFLDINIQVLTKAPVLLNIDSVWRFVEPFSLQLWLVLFGSVIFITLIGWTFESLSPYGFSKSLDRHVRHNYSLGSWFVRAFMLFMVLGTTGDMGRSWSTRIVIVCVFFSAIVFCSHYIAGMTALFSLRTTFTPVTGIDDIRASGVKFGVVDQQAPKDFFEDNIQPQWHVLKQQFQVYPDFTSMVVGVQQGLIIAAAHFDQDLQYVVNQLPCDTSIVGDPFDSTGYAVALNQGHVLTQLFSLMIVKLRNDGTIDALKDQWWNQGGQCPASVNTLPATNQFLPVRLVDFGGLFVVVCIFVILGACVLVLEVFCHRRRHLPSPFVQAANRFCGYMSDDDVADLEEMGIGIEELERAEAEAFRTSVLDAAGSSHPSTPGRGDTTASEAGSSRAGSRRGSRSGGVGGIGGWRGPRDAALAAVASHRKSLRLSLSGDNEPTSPTHPLAAALLAVDGLTTFSAVAAHSAGQQAAHDFFGRPPPDDAVSPDVNLGSGPRTSSSRLEISPRHPPRLSPRASPVPLSRLRPSALGSLGLGLGPPSPRPGAAPSQSSLDLFEDAQRELSSSNLVSPSGRPPLARPSFLGAPPGTEGRSSTGIERGIERMMERKRRDEEALAALGLARRPTGSLRRLLKKEGTFLM